MYDLIGDIHGHADELVQLLEALGYCKRGDGGGDVKRPYQREKAASCGLVVDPRGELMC